jgi:hypothetical protein
LAHFTSLLAPLYEDQEVELVTENAILGNRNLALLLFSSSSSSSSSGFLIVLLSTY